jgi:tripartite-type tricarboxylate transporter receptor subunit TctC
MKRRSFTQLAGLMLAVPGTGALAQGPAGRTARLVVPLPAGSSNDRVARILAPHISTYLNQNFVVDNKAGANGIIGTAEVLRAAPDGLTLLVGSNSPLAANMAFVRNMPYDPRRDLTPIAGASLTNHVLMVKSSFPAKTFAEFLDYARARPGRVSVGYSTASVQLQIATISKQAGVQLLPVPYRGSPATISDVLGGSLDATLTDPGNALAQTKDGGMRALAVSCLKRNPVTPDWPAISETLPGFDFPSWNAFVGPVGMSAELVARISEAVIRAQRLPDVAAQMASEGTTPLIMTPAELKSFIDTETTKWVRLANEAGIQPE